MKKNYETLQKQIDSLNRKVAEVSDALDGFKEEFNTEDFEKDTELHKAIDDKLDECDAEINGTEDGKPEKKKSLKTRKKEIVDAINKMVNMFNENNKLIKETNKSPNEEGLIDLIQRNKEI